jgi:hypothetical protein
MPWDQQPRRTVVHSLPIQECNQSVFCSRKRERRAQYPSAKSLNRKYSERNDTPKKDSRKSWFPDGSCIREQNTEESSAYCSYTEA